MLYHHGVLARVFIATLTGSAMLVSVSAVAQEVHGVIVFGETFQNNGVAYGFAWNFPTKDASQAEAMDACVSSGGTNCIPLAGFPNGCGALAMDRHGNAQGKPGMTLEQAEARALQGCEAAFGGAGCNIVGSVCTTPNGEPSTYSGSEIVMQAQSAQTTVTEPADETPAREEPAPLEDAQMAVTDPVDEPLAREERILIQQALNALGFDAGSADGIFGPRTLAAIYYWQRASGHETTGQLTRNQAAALVAQAAFLAAVEVSPDEEEEAPPIPDADEIPKAQREAVGNQSGNVLTFPESRRCETQDAESPQDAEIEAIQDFLWRQYRSNSSIIYLTNSLSEYELDFDFEVPDGEIRCSGFVRVDGRCQVRSLEGESLESEAAKRRTFQCEPWSWEATQE